MWKSVSELERCSHRFGNNKLININEIEGVGEEDFDFLKL